MKLATWDTEGAQGSVTLQRWASALQLISQCRIDLCGIQEYNPCFPKSEAATTALNNNYKCYAAPRTEPRLAFIVRNTVVPHILETFYSPNGLAGAIRLQLPDRPRRTMACVYSKFNRQDKQEVDLFLQSLQPDDIVMGDYNDDIWSSNPTRPWQEDLANGVFLDPLHASSQPPEPRQYYTCIPRHGRPRRLDAILIRQQIPNIPSTYYDTILMPIPDHAMVLLGIRWRMGAPDPPRMKTAALSHEVVYHTLPTVYQLHIHTTRSEHRPTPTHSTAHPISDGTRGATTTTSAHQDIGHRYLVGNHGPQGTFTQIRGDTRATHTETNRQTAPGSCAQIRLFLEEGQKMAHRTHSPRHTTTSDRRDTVRPQPLCGGPNIRR